MSNNELYRDFIDRKADAIINSLGGTITPAPANAELYRDFLDRKFDDVINSIDNVRVKTLTYMGNGNNTNTIKFPTIPKIILSIDGRGSLSAYMKSAPISWGNTEIGVGYVLGTGTSPTVNQYAYNININNDEITISGSTLATRVFNANGFEYTVLYI